MKKKVKCTKKKLVTAAIAMIASGSLVPTSVSLAENNTVVNQGAVSAVDNSLQLKLGQSTSRANSQTQLIGSFEELKQAFANPDIKEVVLTRDIYMDQTLDTAVINNSDLLINGTHNGVRHTLNFSDYRLDASLDAYSIHFKDINLRNGCNDGLPIIVYREGNVTFENVTHVGSELADGANLRFMGDVDVTLTKSSTSSGNGATLNVMADAMTNVFTSGHHHKGGGDFIVSENAKLTIKTAVPSSEPAMHSIITGQYGGNFILEKNSSMVINQTCPSIYGVFDDFKENVNFNIAEGAILDINSTNGRPGIKAPFNLLNVAPGGTLNVKSKGNYAIWCTGNGGEINLSGAKFNIETGKAMAVSNGQAIRMEPVGTINLKNQNVKAWLEDPDFNNWLKRQVRTAPKFEWDNITGYIRMQSYTATELFTNPINQGFNTTLKDHSFSRIASDGEANKEIVQTTINEVKNTDTQVSGKAEPNAKIELKNGNTVIATGIVGSDGFYSLTIPKQSVGT
ncbi:Ig-like domain-containing protein, partial [Enterococcus faecalis]|uniref:Ig-like domain-containing protein n=1 Tax=Enterococcus faecalis TaxID=1351 RepID=UPI002DB7A5F0